MLEGRDWSGEPGASDAELEQLRAAMPVILPDRFYELLSGSSGGEGPLSKCPWNFILFPIEMMLEIFLRDRVTMEHFAGLIFFGSSGGGSYFAFDTRKGPPFEIICTELIADMDQWISVAPDLDAFLDLVGIEDLAAMDDEFA